MMIICTQRSASFHCVARSFSTPPPPPAAFSTPSRPTRSVCRCRVLPIMVMMMTMVAIVEVVAVEAYMSCANKVDVPHCAAASQWNFFLFETY